MEAIEEERREATTFWRVWKVIRGRTAMAGGGHTDGGRLNWVELLPYVRRIMHDTPGISGYSPHKLVFNRDRHMAGVPYEGTEGAEPVEWFDCVRKFEE